MVFTSLPLYLDPPNWNQQQQGHHQTGGGELQSANIQSTPSAAAGTGIISTASASRAGTSMAERSRVAKIPHPDPALKCPRCDSTNTKFCYFNNYSLSQPRHFCKTCRRYWTRGGALRTVPVGGGCRRNKRSSSSKSSGASKSNINSSAAERQAGAGVSSSSSSSTATSGMIPSGSFHHQLPFLSNLHPLSDFGAPNYVGLNFHGRQPNPIDHAVNYQAGGIGLDQWRIQQFPNFFGGMVDSSSAAVLAAAGTYNPFDAAAGQSDLGFHGGALLPKETASSTSLITQMASVKMEDRNHHPHGAGLNLTRQYLGNISDQYYWGSGGGSAAASGGNWAPGDLSGFNS